MKRQKAAVYDPYLDILGGGEKHILSILKVLEDEGYEASIYWDKNLTKEIHERLNIKFKDLKFLSNIFSISSPLEKMRKLKDIDVLLYVTDGSYFLSTAKKTVIFCMVPNQKLYDMSLVNKIKTWNSCFISNSTYTQSWLNLWGINSKVVYPYIDSSLLETKIENLKKEKVILSVGRFFKHLHAKRHDVLIDTFLSFQKQFPDFKLILAGGLKEEDKGYLLELKELTHSNPSVIFKLNISHSELLNLYRSSSVFWHFAGYEVDEKNHPEMVEHLGMTPLEAMAAGTPTFCYNAGGPKELITDGENGFLFSSQSELITKTKKLVQDSNLYKQIQKQGQVYVEENFSYEIFKDCVVKTLL